MLIITSALLLTFSAGLWNIGIEGQITLGAICCIAVLRAMPETLSILTVPLSIIAALIGSALWALLTGGLRIYNRVHEIFSGLGLNFVASNLCLWLVFGPWQRSNITNDTSSLSLSKTFWIIDLPNLSVIITTAIAILIWLLVWALLTNTHFGLKLHAIGNNPRTGLTIGLTVNRILLIAMAYCGSLAGLAGCLQVLTVYHQLIPSISSGYGYSGLLIAMIANFRPIILLPLCAFLAIIKSGAIQLSIQLGLNSSLTEVIETLIALVCIIIVQGWEQWNSTKGSIRRQN